MKYFEMAISVFAEMKSADFAQMISTLVAVVGLFFIWQQLRLRNKQMRFQALTELHHELIGPRIQEALRLIYAGNPDSLAHPESEEELAKIELVLNTYDLIAFRVRQGVVPGKQTLGTEIMILLRVWFQLEKFVMRQRKLRDDTSYKQHLEWLVKKAKAKNRNKCNGRPKIFDHRKILSPKLETDEKAIRIDDFTIDFGITIGNLDDSKYDVGVRWLSTDFQPADPVASLIADQWQRLSQIAKTRGQMLTDGNMSHLDDYSVTPDDKMSLILNSTTYSVFSATNLLLDYPMIHQNESASPISIRELIDGDLSRSSCYLANPLNVIAIFVTRDRHILIAERSHKVYERPGTWQASVGGAIEPQESPQDALIRETREEWGIKIDKGKIEFLALGINQRTAEPDLIAMVELKETLEKVAEIFKNRPNELELESFQSYAFNDTKGENESKVETAIEDLLEKEWCQPSDQAAFLIALIRTFGRQTVEKGLWEQISKK